MEKFVCGKCNAAGRPAEDLSSETPFVLALWYKDEKGRSHEMVYCRKCKTVHVIVRAGYFLRTARALLGLTPYKKRSQMKVTGLLTTTEEPESILPPNVIQALVEDGVVERRSS